MVMVRFGSGCSDRGDLLAQLASASPIAGHRAQHVIERHERETEPEAAEAMTTSFQVIFGFALALRLTWMPRTTDMTMKPK